DTLFPKLIGHIKKDTISERTCRNYMYSWGFKYDERRKGIYFDGYERPDVVVYRNEWVKRMFVYKKNMKDFVGESLEFVLEPRLNLGEKEYVQITYDECYFYANDERRRIWIQKGENILRPKHLKHFIIVFAFLCP
ncbi:23605_t:CDS:1, partial [Racocetra persica]